VQVLVSQPTWVIPTAKGLFVCGLRYRLWKPKLATLAHVGAMNDVRLHIQTQKPESEWLSERQLTAEAKDQAGARRHVPDGVLLLAGHSVAIEVELNVKNPSRLEAILDDLVERFDGILYYCAPGPHRKLKQLEESERWPSLGVRELPRPTGLEGL
jgi:hypothetical protein